jgi:sulfur-carrier protein
MRLRYFAWLRERIGRGEEVLELPLEVKTIDDLITHLITLDETYEYAFEHKHLIRAAINQKHVKHDTLIEGAHEIAFFPPMTGG